MSKKDKKEVRWDDEEIHVPSKEELKGHRNNNKRKRDKDRKFEDDRWN
jgi:hypothetical protein